MASTSAAGERPANVRTVISLLDIKQQAYRSPPLSALRAESRLAKKKTETTMRKRKGKGRNQSVPARHYSYEGRKNTKREKKAKVQ